MRAVSSLCRLERQTWARRIEEALSLSLPKNSRDAPRMAAAMSRPWTPVTDPPRPMVSVGGEVEVCVGGERAPVRDEERRSREFQRRHIGEVRSARAISRPPTPRRWGRGGKQERGRVGTVLNRQARACVRAYLCERACYKRFTFLLQCTPCLGLAPTFLFCLHFILSLHSTHGTHAPRLCLAGETRAPCFIHRRYKRKERHERKH